MIAPERVLEMMRECVRKIDNFVCDLLTKQMEEMPDVEEDKGIFIDSVIIGAFCYSFNQRMRMMDNETKRFYIDNATRYIESVLVGNIGKNELKENNDET
jgi:hypothetical protein